MMIKIPQQIMQQFDIWLDRDKVPVDKHDFFKKWLRYYLDFCQKYEHAPQNIESLPLFINKLREKKQSKQQQKQAFDSIIIYYKIFNIYPDWSKTNDNDEIKEQTVSYNENRAPVVDKWEFVYKQLSDEIKVRHYSPKTFKAYSTWSKKFQNFVENKPLEQLTPE
ncbi:MAG: integron integrase, partial [Desulfobulbaceae bacterium]|nr:integron integrase [Desulfobulbaceae bacterium]